MTDQHASSQHPVPVVGIGASAGGLEAMSQLICRLDAAWPESAQFTLLKLRSLAASLGH